MLVVLLVHVNWKLISSKSWKDVVFSSYIKIITHSNTFSLKKKGLKTNKSWYIPQESMNFGLNITCFTIMLLLTLF